MLINFNTLFRTERYAFRNNVSYCVFLRRCFLQCRDLDAINWCQCQASSSSSMYGRKRQSDTILLIARFMVPTWGPSGADRTQVGPMLTLWTLLSGTLSQICDQWYKADPHPLELFLLYQIMKVIPHFYCQYSLDKAVHYAKCTISTPRWWIYASMKWVTIGHKPLTEPIPACCQVGLFGKH